MLGNLTQQSPERSDRNHALEQAADRAPRANIHRTDAEHGMPGSKVLVQFDVIDANHFASMNVDDLLVEQVARQQEQTFGPVCDRPSRGRAIDAQAAIHRIDGTEGHHPVAGLGANDEHCNPRSILLGRNRHLAHTPALASSRIKHGQA
jgi:hypothetical protein